MTLRIGMVAGEPSGDLLAARVMRGLADHAERIEGIGGPAMQEQGLDCWHPMDALSVFGYVDALKRLPGLISTYRDVRKRWLARRPDVFVGIDAPDFNLRLEQQLRANGIPTVHFVGPSIWAWRYERIHAIRKSVSHMLVLFPFEEALYQKEGIPVTYVGHPLAQVIPLKPDQAAARARLGLPADSRILALMPGSRASEIKMLAPRFLRAAQLLLKEDPSLQVLVPMVNPARRAEFEAIFQSTPIPNCRIISSPSRSEPSSTEGVAGQAQEGDADTGAHRPVAWDVMEAADAVLVASGTATLEAALFKRPMVISYVLTPMMRRLMAWKSGQERPSLPWVGLPNILAQDFVVPELLQEDAAAERLAQACSQALGDTTHRQRVVECFTGLHQALHRDTPALAAQAILNEARRVSA